MTTQELIAIQQNGPKALGFFGTRNMGFLHQNLIEILSYAMVLTVCFSNPPSWQHQRRSWLAGSPLHTKSLFTADESLEVLQFCSFDAVSKV